MQGNREEPTLGKRGRREEMYNMAVLSLTKQSGSHMTRESTGVNHHMIGQQHQAADRKSALNQPRMLGTCLQLPQLAKSKGSQRLTRKHFKPFWLIQTTSTQLTSKGQKAKTNVSYSLILIGKGSILYYWTCICTPG